MALRKEGLRKLYPPEVSSVESCKIDVVIIPGIATIQPDDWKDVSGLWLRELISSISPDAQMWLFEYLVDENLPVFPQLFLMGRALLKSLASRLDTPGGSKPLVLICHSLGGLILKSALCSSRKGFQNSVINSIVNIVFLSTPHLTRNLEPSSDIMELILRSHKISSLKHKLIPDGNKKMCELCEDFEQALLPIPVLSAYEGLPSKILGYTFFRFRKAKNPSQVTIVDGDRASVRAKAEDLVEVQATHNNICKLPIGGLLYLKIREICQQAIETSPGLVARSLKYEPPLALGENLSQIRITDIVYLDTLTETRTQESIKPAIAEAPALTRIALPCFSRQSVERNPNFFGRSNVLALLDENLLPQSNPLADRSNLSVFALCGMGGLGKTQVAVEYAFSREAHFDAIFWLYADDKTILAQSISNITIELGLEKLSEGTQNLAISRDIFLEWLANPVKDLKFPMQEGNQARWLIIFDNADDPKVLDDYWPVKGCGSVLITSRDPNAKRRFGHSQSGCDLAPLSIEEGASFMEQLTEEQPLSKSGDSLDQVSKLLGGLPLAIAQMAGLIVDLRLSSYNEFLQFYNEAGAKQLYKMKGEETKLGYNRTLATVWALDNLSAETLALFRVISLLDPDRVPEVILTSGSSDIQLLGYPKNIGDYYKARAQLLKSSLVKVNDAKRELSVHRVVQAETLAEMNDLQFRDAFQAGLSLVVKVWPFQSLRKRHDLGRKEACERLYPSVIRLKRAFDDVDTTCKFQPHDDFAELLNDLGWYLLERGFVQESKSYYQLAQHICENSPNKDSDKVALTLRMSHNNQTTAAAETNERKDCLDHSLIWLKMSIERLTPENLPLVDYELGIVYNETGVAYGMNEMWETAAEYFIKSMNIMRELDNYDDTMLGWPEPNLGLVYWIQGKHSDAEVVLNEILEIHATAYGVDDTKSFKTGKILHALGNLSWSQGRMVESFDFHKRSFDQYMVTLGSGHHRIADVRHRLAMHYMRLEILELDKAEDMINHALNVFRAGLYHVPEVSRSTFKKSQILRLKSDFVGSQKLEDDAVKLRRSLVPKDNRPASELKDEDFDTLPIFWSR